MSREQRPRARLVATPVGREELEYGDFFSVQPQEYWDNERPYNGVTSIFVWMGGPGMWKPFTQYYRMTVERMDEPPPGND